MRHLIFSNSDRANFTEVSRNDATFAIEFEIANNITTLNVDNRIMRNSSTLSANLFVRWNAVEDALIYKSGGVVHGSFIWSGSVTSDNLAHIYRIEYDGTTLRAYIDNVEADNSVTVANVDFSGFARFGDTNSDFDFYRFRYWSDISKTTLVHDWNADSTQSNGSGTILYDDESNNNASFDGTNPPTWDGVPPPPSNTAPTANAGADQSNITAGTIVTLDASSSTDGDGTIVSYAWTQTAGTSADLNSPNSTSTTFTAPFLNANETLTFQVEVTDDGGLTSTDTVDISVLEFVAEEVNKQGLSLYSESQRYLEIPQYTFPSSGNIVITCEFYINRQINENRSVYTFADAFNTISMSIDSNGTGRVLIATETNMVSIEIGTIQQGVLYLTELTIPLLVTSNIVCDVNGTDYTGQLADNSTDSLKGMVTTTATVGNQFGATFLDGIFYLLNLDGVKNYSTVDSDNQTDEVTDTLNALAPANIINPSSNQWVQNAEPPTGDITPPDITITGDNPVTITQGSTYVDQGATALDDVDGVVAVTTTSNNVDTSTIQNGYEVVYSATDAAGNTATVTRTVNVVAPADVTPPVITLLGDNPVTITQGANYTDAGATALDNIDGDITNNIVTVNPVTPSTIGQYAVTYNVSDSAGNNATEVTRTVNVVAAPDTTKPVINLSPSTLVYNLTVGDTFTLPTATLTDDTDNTRTITPTSNNVDTSTAGSYSVVYSGYEDAAGNIADTVTITVNVAEAPQASNELQTSEFSLVTDNILMSFKDRSNIEVMQFKVPNAIANELGLFDFTANNVTKVEVTTAINSSSGSTIDSDSSAVSFEDDKLFVELGALTGIGVQSMAVIIYTAEDSKGLVICGPGLNDSNAVVTFIN